MIGISTSAAERWRSFADSVPTPADTPSSSWPLFLAYISPPAAALLYATAKWVESRARITSEVERSISRELDATSNEVPEQRDGSA